MTVRNPPSAPPSPPSPLVFFFFSFIGSSSLQCPLYRRILHVGFLGLSRHPTSARSLQPLSTLLLAQENERRQADRQQRYKKDRNRHATTWMSCSDCLTLFSPAFVKILSLRRINVEESLIRPKLCRRCPCCIGNPGI